MAAPRHAAKPARGPMRTIVAGDGVAWLAHLQAFLRGLRLPHEPATPDVLSALDEMPWG